MSIEKAEIKVGTAHEIGCRLDDLLDGVNKDLYRLEGAATAFRKGAESVAALAKIVDGEIDKGEYDLEVATRIKRFIGRAQQMLVNLAVNADNNRITQVGKVQAMQTAVGAVKKFKDAEEAKVNSIRQAMLSSNGEAVAGEPRPVGVRPPLSVKNRRLAEELAQSQLTVSTEAAPSVEADSAEKTGSADEAEPEPEPESASEPMSDETVSEASVLRRRGRKPKS